MSNIPAEMAAQPARNGRAWRIAAKSMYERSASAVEATGAAVIIGSALLFLSFFVQAMATTSLWYDEIYSIQFFSGRGPLTAITDYSQPNNHIFFNLLNALTPGAGSYDPLRARLWSFVLLGATLTIVLAVFVPRKQFLSAALLFQVVAVNNGLVDLDLQARGYGLCALCAFASVLVLRLYIAEPRRLWLALLCLLTLLGVWTLPDYAFFAAPLLLFLFAQFRRRAVFIAGALTALAIVAVYAPVLGQLADQETHYAANFGREYGTPDAVATTLTEYLLHPSVFGLTFPNWTALAFLGLLAALVALGFVRPYTDAVTVRIVVPAVLVFFGLCLWLQTPPLRTTAFVVLPLALCAVLIVCAVLDTPRLRLVRPVLALLCALFFAQHNIQAAGRFHFTPIEDWRGMADYIARTFPSGTQIYAVRPNILSAYLDPAYPLAKSLDKPKFAAGQQILADNPFDYRNQISVAALSPIAAQVVIPKRYQGLQIIAAAPPPDPHISRITVNGLPQSNALYDRNATTGWTTGVAQSALAQPVTLRVELQPGLRYRSLFLRAPQGNGVPLNTTIRAHLADGTIMALDDAAVDKYGDSLILHLGDAAVTAVEITVSVSRASQPFALREVWAYPARLP